MPIARKSKTSSCCVMAMGLLFSTALLAATVATASPLVEISSYDSENIHAHITGTDLGTGQYFAEERKNQVWSGDFRSHGDLTKAQYHVLQDNDTSTTDSTSSSTSTTTTKEPISDEKLNTWSVAWYLTLLGAFIVFFILIGLTEIFCRRRARESRWHIARRDGGQLACQAALENVEPPPSYDLFKPPSYSTLFPPELVKCPQKVQDGSPPQHKQLVYVVSMHSGRGVS